MRRAAELATEDDIAALEDILRAQDHARDTDDFDSFYVLDDAFHQALCDLSRAPRGLAGQPARPRPPQPHPAAEHAGPELPRD